ncbi:hypothetical protein C440_00490 [Haloferax mucosum ATCC BAA-1512]|uniref:DUF8173 domain-containing protein n=1 Tax=Haloferax mucosum ATCC BAA-1512 TaxID=662479 RepID=M0ISJ6_9EURY|nr:hypothetical protein C440_00490 [Haloferax mucosum ATCC BAA-1512]
MTTLLSLLGLLALAGTAAAQHFGSVPETSTIVGIGFSLILNLVFGGILVAAGPDYTRNSISEIRSNPGRSFVWGLGVSLFAFVVLILSSFIPLLGLLLVVVVVLVFVVLIVIGSAVATVFLGSLVVKPAVGRSPSLGVSLLVGAIGSTMLSVIPVLGATMVLGITVFGVGVVGRHAYLSMV